MADKTKLWKEIVSNIRHVSPAIKSYFDNVAGKLSWLDDNLVNFTTESTRNLLKDWIPLLDDAINTSVR